MCKDFIWSFIPFHTRTVRSSPDEINSPESKTSTEYTKEVCPYNTCKQVPSSFQTRKVLVKKQLAPHNLSYYSITHASFEQDTNVSFVTRAKPLTASV